MEAKNRLNTQIITETSKKWINETIVKIANIFIKTGYSNGSDNYILANMFEDADIETTYNYEELLNEINSYDYLVNSDALFYLIYDLTEDQQDKIYEELDYIKIDKTVLNYILKELQTDNIYNYFDNIGYYEIDNEKTITIHNNKINLTEHLKETISNITYYKPYSIYPDIIETLETETYNQINNIIKTT